MAFSIFVTITSMIFYFNHFFILLSIYTIHIIGIKNNYNVNGRKTEKLKKVTTLKHVDKTFKKRLQNTF